MIVSISEAKANMSKLMRLLESGQEKEIIVCHRGTPVFRWLPISAASEEPRPFGIYKDKYPNVSEGDFFALDEEIASEFRAN